MHLSLVDLIKATIRTTLRATDTVPSANDYREAQAQSDCFPTELVHLKPGMPLPANSPLLTLTAELDSAQLI